MKIHSFGTKEDATKAAVEMFGALAVEMEVIHIFKIGPTIAKHFNVDEGYGFEDGN